MLNPLCQEWFLLKKMNEALAPLAIDPRVTPIIEYDPNQIVWDEGCDVGRVSWHVRWHLPPDDASARALVSIYNKRIASCRKDFDLGLTCER